MSLRRIRATTLPLGWYKTQAQLPERVGSDRDVTTTLKSLNEEVKVQQQDEKSLQAKKGYADKVAELLCNFNEQGCSFIE